MKTAIIIVNDFPIDLIDYLLDNDEIEFIFLENKFSGIDKLLCNENQRYYFVDCNSKEELIQFGLSVRDFDNYRVIRQESLRL